MRLTNSALHSLCFATCLAVVAAPTHTALAAPAPTTTPTRSTGPTPTPTETTPTPDPAAPVEGQPPVEGAPVEGQPPAEGEVPAEGETPVEGQPTEPPPPEPAPEPEPAPAPAAEPPPPEPVVDTGPQRPEEPRVGNRPRNGTGLLIAGGATLGVGIGLTIGFSFMTAGCKIEGPLACKYRDQDQFLIPLGVAVTLLGGMLLAVGAGYRVQYKKWENWSPADAQKKKRGRKAQAVVAPTFMGRSAGIGAVGRF